MSLRTATAVLILAIAAGGCGGPAAPGVEQRSDGEQHQSGGAESGQTTVVSSDGRQTVVSTTGTSMVIEGADQKTVIAHEGQTVALPKSWPSDVPVYAGAKVTFAQEVPNVTTVMFQSLDKTQAVGDHYAQALVDRGWKIETNTKTDDELVISASKPQRNCTLSVTTEADSTTILISLAAVPAAPGD